MRGWWVDTDGNPVAYKDQNSKPRGVDSVFIRKVMPSEDPYHGRGYKWDFVNEDWKEGSNPVKDDIDRSEQKRDQLKSNAVQAFRQLDAALKDDATNWANAAVIKSAFTRTLDIFRYVASRLDD